MTGPVPVARIVVRGERRLFVATDVTREAWMVDAVGRWEYRRGPNYSLRELGPEVRRSWPVRDCEIRWVRAEELAA